MARWRCPNCLDGTDYREAERADERCMCGARVPAWERTALYLERLVAVERIALPLALNSSELSPVISHEVAAKVLGCSLRQVRALVANGRVKSAPRIGRHPRVYRAEVEALALGPPASTQVVPVPKPKRRTKVPAGLVAVPSDFDDQLEALRQRRKG